jgi:CheY-like chemotaxis protein
MNKLTIPSVKSVLLVDDDQDTQRVLQRVLEHSGIACEVVSSAPEALSSARSAQFDMIIIDMILPGMDGIQLHEQLVRSGTQAIFVGTTAYYTSETEQDLKAKGFMGFLPKPFDLPTLPSDLARIVNKG